jgi:hypothetical protein
MRISRSLRITKLQALLLIDLIITAFAAGGHYYLQTRLKPPPTPPTPPPPRPAEFQITNLTIDRPEAGVGEVIRISVKLSNVGEDAGSHSVNLTINDVVRETKTLQLLGGENTTVEFTVTETSEGSYSVKIGSLTGTYKIVATPPPPPPPKPATFNTYNLDINPYEAWVDEPITISITVRNVGDERGSYSLSLIINNEVRENRTVQLSGGEATTEEFTVTEDSEGSYEVKLGIWTRVFSIVPTGMHTLSISGSTAGIEFTLDGQIHTTPYSSLLNVGHTYTVKMAMTNPTGEYVFLRWEDGSTNPTRTINLTRRMTITAFYSGGSSCPSLFIWNGTSYVYVAEVSNHGWLGYINYINEDGSIVFWRNDPWDYLKLDRGQLQPRNNYYDLKLTQRWDEIFYIDAAYMLVVDHPSNVTVYSTGVEQYIDPNFMGKIYTVSKDPLTPISAVNEKEEDVLPQISKIDGIFTPGINGINSPSWDNISWNRLTLNLGDLSNAEQIKLVVTGKVDWGSPDDYNTWIDNFFAQPVPNGTQITPPPYMEVKDVNGNWVRAPESRQFPIPPDVSPRTWVVDLTDLFPTNDYSLRINNFWNVTFDYIGVDTTSQTDVIIQRIDPQASLYQVFTTYSKSEGNFTRYGDVTQLVLDADDKFVIGRQGDEVSLKFPSTDIAPAPENMERDIFLFVSGWFKDKYGNWGFGFGFTVDPLPFQDMSGFPYPPTESYPYDEDHLSYLLEYNTRTRTSP